MTTPQPKKSATATDRILKVGDLIYWDGDMANPSHRFLVLSIAAGSVARVRDVCGSTDCDNSGREQSLPVVLVYSFRWGWQDERNAARAWTLEEMMRRRDRNASTKVG